MSRPTAMEQARQRADLIKAVSTYAQLRTVTDALDGVITAETARYGADSAVAGHLMEMSQALAFALNEADRRCRE